MPRTIKSLSFNNLPSDYFSDALVVINPKGIILDWQASAPSIFKYLSKEVKKKHFAFLFSQYEKNNNEIIKHIISEQKLIGYKTIFLDKESNPIFVEINLIPFINKNKSLSKFYLFIKNYSSEKLAQDDAAYYKSIFDNVINKIHYGIFIVDLETNEILFSNQYAKSLLGIDKLEYKIFDFIDFSFLEKAKQLFNPLSEINSNIPFEFKINDLTKKHSYFIDCYFSRLSFNTRPSLLLVFKDITDQKNFIRRLEENIKDKELQTATKTRFLANMSHELRSPINIIMGYLEILITENYVEGEAKEFLTYINKSTEHLLKLLNEVLDLSKAEAGKLKLDEKPHNLIALMKSVLSLIEIQLLGKKVALDYNSSIDADAYFIVDAHNLQRVLLNLLSNAVKFTSEGLISINVKYSNGVLSFSVSDTGIGMTENEIERAFIPFEQANSGIAVKYGGTGLGLAITKEIISLWGGDIKIESKKNVGTTIIFTYPATRTEQIADTESSDTSFDFTTLQNKNLLVVDDQEYNHKLFKLMLSMCTVETIFSGKLAINKLITENYDGLLLDLHLIDINGLEVLNEIRKRERLNNLKIVVISADILSNLKKEIEERGYIFLPKPVKRNDLLKAFNKLFANS